MNTTLLIDALVRQTTVLLATLATTTEQRTPLPGRSTYVGQSLQEDDEQNGDGDA
jgi:hypothetical protein